MLLWSDIVESPRVDLGVDDGGLAVVIPVDGAAAVALDPPLASVDSRLATVISQYTYPVPSQKEHKRCILNNDAIVVCYLET